MKELDLTQGSVPKVLLQFALPFLLANLLQALYGGADLFVVGQYDDAASVAGVAIGSQVMQTITGIILGLTTGTTILIAIATGGRNDREAASTFGTSACFFTLAGVILAAIMVALHGHIAELMHTPAEAMADTRHYILICSAGIPFIMGYNVVCGVLRGLGDSRSPLYFVGIACVINIAFNFLLVGAFGMRAAGGSHSHGVLAGRELRRRPGIPAQARLPLRLLAQRHTVQPPAVGAHTETRSAHSAAGCARKRVVPAHHCHRKPDGSGGIGSARRIGKDSGLRHATAHGNGIGGSYDDGTELWCRTDRAHDGLPQGWHSHVTGVRRVGVRLLPGAAGDAHDHLHHRHCRGKHGSRLPAGV